MEQPLQPLTPAMRAPVWEFDPTCGYYVHLEQVYLQGMVSNNGGVGGAVGATILTGLPAAIRPSAPVRVQLLVESPSTNTPGAEPPMTVNATVTPAGELVLDSLPPFINAAPPSPPYRYFTPTAPDHTGTWHDDFPGPLIYTIQLGNASWPLPDVQPDAWTPESFRPYATHDFEWVDATIAVHGARVHLGGRLRARSDGAFQLCGPLPAKYITDLSPPGWNPVDVGGSETVAGGPDGAYQIRINTDGSLFLAGDPPVEPDPPGWNALQIVEGFPVPGLDNKGGGFLRRQGSFGRFNLAVEDYDAYTEATWDNGQFECFARPSIGGERFSTWCKIPGLAPTISLDVATAVGNYYPAPEWFAIELTCDLRGFDGTGGVEAGVDGCGPDIEIVPGEFNPTCGPEFALSSPEASCDTACELVSVDGTGHGSGPWSFSLSAGRGQLDGLLARPGRAISYPDDTPNTATTLLWQPGEISHVHLTLPGVSNRGLMRLGLRVFPFWRTRRHYLKAGDILDLTGAGWQSLSGVAPGTISAGQGPSGVRARQHPVSGQVSDQAAVLAPGGQIPGGGVPNTPGPLQPANTDAQAGAATGALTGR